MNRCLAVLLFCAAVAIPPAAYAEPSAPATEFARIDRDGHGAPRAFQTAIVTYAPATGPRDFSVDLIGAIHVADAAYYEDLNERFRGYDALLFELIVPDGKRPSPGPRRRMSWIGAMQNGLKDLLGLSYQLDEIDYGAPNFVHADLSTGMLADSMQERDESLYVYFWRIVFASLEQYRKDPLGTSDLQLMSALLTGSDNEALKVVVAEELLASIESGDIFGGENGSAIIAARNEHAMGVLRQQLDGHTGRIGIFYGVGHMADFERRLIELGLARTSVEWVDAWRFAEQAP